MGCGPRVVTTRGKSLADDHRRLRLCNYLRGKELLTERENGPATIDPGLFELTPAVAAVEAL